MNIKQGINGQRPTESGLRLITDKDLFPDLESIEGRPADKALDHLEVSLAPKSHIFSSANTLDAKRALESAKAQTRQQRFLLTEAETRLEDASQKFHATRPQNRWSMILNAVVAAVALGSDIGLTCTVLPTLLNVPPRTVLGMALGCTPLVATLILKGIFDRLFDTLGFYHSKPEGSWPRRIAETVEYFLHAGFLTANIVMLIKLAQGREEAVKIIQAMIDFASNTPAPPLNEAVISSLVIWVGLVAVLDSALVIQRLLRQAHDADQRRQTQNALAAFRREVTEHHRALVDAEAAEAVEEEQWRTSDQRAQCFEAALTQRDLAQLAEIRSRSRESRALKQVVDETYAHNWRANGLPC